MFDQFTEWIHNLTDLRVEYVPIDGSGKSHVSLPPELFMPKKESVELVKDPQGIRFILAYYSSGFFVIGPLILETDPIPRKASHHMNILEFPAFPEVKIQTYMSAISLLVKEKDLPVPEPADVIETHNPVFEESYSVDLDQISSRYKWERKIRHCISTGNRSELENILSDMVEGFDFSDRVPNNPVRAYKNIAIVSNSIGRLSAEKGGLPPFLLHSLSEGIAIKIESITSIRRILEYTREIPMLYCNAVHNYGIENHSAHIVKACHYILENLHSRIELSELAEHTGTHRSYLSRRFHEETGQTISAYIREKRIMESKWMLRNSKETITDIALSLGFDDINYFSRIFRKETGMSPSRYRQQYSSSDFNGLPD